MKLYHHDVLVGTLSDYCYETPWASARIAPQDAALYARLCRASQFLDNDIEEDWGNLSREEEDAEYARRLERYGISDADIARLHDGAWNIREGDHPDRNGAIILCRCSDDGWIEWRW